MEERNYNYDVLRALAITFVVLIHSCGIVMEHQDVPAVFWLTSVLQGIINTGVPLFLMLSGALLLGREEPLGAFCKKRFPRILLPFLCWSLLFYPLLFHPLGLHSLWDYPYRLLTGGIHGVYWFVYTIIGLYLLTPVLRLALREKSVGLWLGGLTLALFLLHQFFPSLPTVEGIWIPDIQHLLCFVGGFLMVRHLKEWKWIRPVSLAVAAVFFLLQVASARWYPNEFSFYVFTAAGLFGWMLSWKPLKPRKLVTFMSQASYGIYLSHIAVVSLIVRFYGDWMPVALTPFTTALGTLALTLPMLWILRKIRLQKFFM